MLFPNRDEIMSADMARDLGIIDFKSSDPVIVKIRSNGPAVSFSGKTVRNWWDMNGIADSSIRAR